MTDTILTKLFEHNNWANHRIIQTCAALSEEQLDAEPQSATKGSVRRTLWHLVGSQQHYLSLLTGIEPPFAWQAPPPFSELALSARISGQGLLALAGDSSNELLLRRLTTDDGYYTEPWVVLVQVINHATEHREQISSMLTALSVTPPCMDGWSYGEAINALVPVEK